MEYLVKIILLSNRIAKQNITNLRLFLKQIKRFTFLVILLINSLDFIRKIIHK